MFNLPADMLYEIYEFDSFKYDVWEKIMSQFLKGGFYRKTLNIQGYVKYQGRWCRRYCACGLRINPVKLWLQNIKLFDTTTKALAKSIQAR